MSSNLYLQPPTLAEFGYVALADLFKPKESYSIVLELTDYFPILLEPFSLPKDPEFKEYCGSLKESLSNLTYTHNFEPVQSKDLKNDFNNMFQYLSPSTSWSHNGGECKAFSVFAVTYLRKNNVSSRFRLFSSDHQVIEKLVKSNWVVREPQNLDKKITLSSMSFEFNKYYTKLLKRIKIKNRSNST